jgi:hypothetical protein
VKFRDTRKYFSEDLMLNLELISHIRTAAFISVPYYNYFQNPSSHLHNSENAKRRLSSLAALFRDYISDADDEMKKAAAYTAAMILIYNAGLCAKEDRKYTEKFLSDKETVCCIKTALGRKCSIKHRAFLTAIRLSPKAIKRSLAQKYSERWEK